MGIFNDTRNYCKKIVYLLVVGLFCITDTGFVLAQTKPLTEAQLRNRGIIFVDPNDLIAYNCTGGAGGGNIGSGPVLKELPPEIPEPYRTIFPQAATKVNMDVAILTTLFYVEHGRSFPEPPPPYGQGDPWASSPVGASGPFQFMPDTWNSYVTVARDELKINISNVMDLADAAVGAAVFMRALGATPGTMPIGDPQNAIGMANTSEVTVVNLMASYNAGPGYDSREARYAETEAYVRVGSEFYDALVNNKLSTLLNNTNTAQGTSPVGLVYTGCSAADAGKNGTYATLGSMTYYGQCDPAWYSYSFGEGGVCYSGCGPTSLAMVISTLTGDKKITPPIMADAVAGGGWYVPGVGTAHAAFLNIPPRYGLKAQALSHDMAAVKQVVQNGGLVIAAVFGPGSFTQAGHIIVIRGFTPAGKVLVADPNDSLVGYDDYQRKSTTEWDESLIMAESSNFYGITK